ncbi:MAG: hypothetical protein KGJ02_01835 [Verrucomicrobiota bacterium]|nr:hypothetical protein [Verrucomicrobiota bacterium]
MTHVKPVYNVYQIPRFSPAAENELNLLQERVNVAAQPLLKTCGELHKYVSEEAHSDLKFSIQRLKDVEQELKMSQLLKDCSRAMVKTLVLVSFLGIAILMTVAAVKLAAPLFFVYAALYFGAYAGLSTWSCHHSPLQRSSLIKTALLGTVVGLGLPIYTTYKLHQLLKESKPVVSKLIVQEKESFCLEMRGLAHLFQTYGNQVADLTKREKDISVQTEKEFETVKTFYQSLPQDLRVEQLDFEKP